MEAADVHRLAGALGAELRRLSERFGTAALAGLVAQPVRLLESLERRAAGGEAPQAAEQRPAETREQERRLQSRPAQLGDEEPPSRPAEGEGAGCRERGLMLQLKAVVDRQRDAIRARDHEIQCKARDVEALQEQLSRFMAVNETLRRKLAVAQAQLRGASERTAELEAQRGVERRSRAAGPTRAGTPGEEEEGAAGGAAAPPEHPPDQRAFSKEELQQILQERNELKTSLFLVEEELAYYQRELLTGERVPALLLQAVKSAIKKQRKKIWAKMLGTEEGPAGREEEEEEEEEEGSPGADHPDGPLPRIKSFFSQWYHRTESGPGAWEILSTEDVVPGEAEREVTPSGSSPPGPTSPLP